MSKRKGIQDGPYGVYIDPSWPRLALVGLFVALASCAPSWAAPVEVNGRAPSETSRDTRRAVSQELTFAADGSATDSGMSRPDGEGGPGISDGPDIFGVHRWRGGGIYESRECTFAESYRCQQDCDAAAGPYAEIVATDCEVQYRPSNYYEVNAPRTETRVCGCYGYEVNPSNVAR